METNSGSGRLRYSKQEWQGFVSEFLASGVDGCQNPRKSGGEFR
ncbi:hypothetical protein [Ferrovum sp.]|jgi:hypothetical protein|nr:hypothetical protein [Ferrovum sp.]